VSERPPLPPPPPPSPPPPYWSPSAHYVSSRAGHT
jgi:hypothetical protein